MKTIYKDVRDEAIFKMKNQCSDDMMKDDKVKKIISDSLVDLQATSSNGVTFSLIDGGRNSTYLIT